MTPNPTTKLLVWIVCILGILGTVIGTQILLNGAVSVSGSVEAPGTTGGLGDLWTWLRALPYQTVMTACLVLGVVQLVYGYFYSGTFWMLGWVCLAVFGASFFIEDWMMIDFFDQFIAFLGRLFAYIV